MSADTQTSRQWIWTLLLPPFGLLDQVADVAEHYEDQDHQVDKGLSIHTGKSCSRVLRDLLVLSSPAEPLMIPSICFEFTIVIASGTETATTDAMYGISSGSVTIFMCSRYPGLPRQSQ
jgi:hypothetical protein